MSLSVQAETVMLFHLFFQYVKDHLLEALTKKWHHYLWIHK